jgi:prophage regulatory protein
MVIVEKKQHNRIIVRGKDFRKTFGIPDSTRADWENEISPRFHRDFPMKINLGSRSVGYFYDEVIAWLESRRPKK